MPRRSSSASTSLCSLTSRYQRAYADIYHGTLRCLYQRSSESPLLVDELKHLYDIFIQKQWIAANTKMQYIFSFLRGDVIFPEKTPEDIRESVRLLYGAMTKAKKRLHITYRNIQMGKPYSIDKESTPFLRHTESLPLLIL